MQRKWGWLLAAAVIILVGSVLGIRIWFMSPGVHVLGKEIHVNLTEICYLIDGQTEEVLDETILSINGGTSRSDRMLFDGEMKVLGYENSASGTVTGIKSIEVTDSGCWMITHIENCTHQENVDGIIKDVEHFCDYQYTYYVYPEDPQATVVLIDSFNDPAPIYAVCASDEEEAQKDFVRFLERRL